MVNLFIVFDEWFVKVFIEVWLLIIFYKGIFIWELVFNKLLIVVLLIFFFGVLIILSKLIVLVGFVMICK